MQDSKLYILIQSLDKKLLKKLIGLINEKLSIQQENKYILIQYITQKIQQNKTEFDKKVIFKTVFKNVLNENKINAVMTDAVKFLEDFIVTEEVLSDNEMKNFYLSKYYYQHKLNSYFEQSYKQTQLKDNKKILLRDYAIQTEIEFIHAKYAALNNNRDVELNSVEINLQEYYSTWKIKLDNLTTIRLETNTVKYEPKNILYVIHLDIRELFKTQREALYKSIITTIKVQAKYIHLAELRVILMLLDNFCIQQINAGKKDYINHVFELYKIMIELEVLLDDDDTLLAGQYKNIITVALRTQSYDWAEGFLNAYKNNIRDNQSEVAYVFNKACIAFEKKEYKFCLQVLSEMVFKDFFYKLTVKRMQIKSLFMLYINDRTYFETLYGHINAFKKYIYTKKNLPVVYQETNKNFYKFIHQLFFVNIKGNEDMPYIQTKIKECEMLADKNWLLEISSNHNLFYKTK